MDVIIPPGFDARLTEDSSLSRDTEGKLPRILIVDDEVHILKAIQRLFMGMDFEIATASSGSGAIELLESSEFTVIISDQRMPGISGSALLKHTRKHHPNVVRVMLTGNNDIATAIKAINDG
ncbi:MAG: response regulator [Bradymonadaceae bacterium]